MLSREAARAKARAHAKQQAKETAQKTFTKKAKKAGKSPAEIAAALAEKQAKQKAREEKRAVRAAERAKEGAAKEDRKRTRAEKHAAKVAKKAERAEKRAARARRKEGIAFFRCVGAPGTFWHLWERIAEHQGKTRVQPKFLPFFAQVAELARNMTRGHSVRNVGMTPMLRRLKEEAAQRRKKTLLYPVKRCACGAKVGAPHLAEGCQVKFALDRRGKKFETRFVPAMGTCVSRELEKLSGAAGNGQIPIPGYVAPEETREVVPISAGALTRWGWDSESELKKRGFTPPTSELDSDDSDGKNGIYTPTENVTMKPVNLPVSVDERGETVVTEPANRFDVPDSLRGLPRMLRIAQEMRKPLDR